MGGQYHVPFALPQGKRPDTHCCEAGWTQGPVWKGAENIALTGIRSPNRSACRESLYRLSYPGPQDHVLRTFNPLTRNDPYRGRSAPLTSKRCILYIYSTNIGTEYFKHSIYSPFLPLQNAVCFIILTCLVPVLFTFYLFIQQI